MTAEKLVVAVDVDNVLADFLQAFQMEVLERYKVRLLTKDVTKFDLYELLGITKEEAEQLYRDTILGRVIHPVDGAVKGMQELAKRYTLYAVTSRHESLLHHTGDWLAEHKIPVWGVFHKSFMFNVKFDAWIDDSVRELLSRKGQIKHLLLMDAPWNQGYNVNNTYIRVHNWNHILEVL